jgi:hypothetical protein
MSLLRGSAKPVSTRAFNNGDRVFGADTMQQVDFAVVVPGPSHTNYEQEI